MLTLTRMTKTEPAYVPPKWSAGTDAEIIDALNRHYNPDDPTDLTEYWSVGDVRTISLSAITTQSPLSESYPATDVKFVLANKGGKTLTSPINGKSECAFVVLQITTLPWSYSSSATYGYFDTRSNYALGWEDSQRKAWCYSQFYNAIPETIRPIFKQCKNSSVHSPVSITEDISNDYFSLLSIKEIAGEDSESWSWWTTNNRITSSIESKTVQFEWLEDSSNRQRIVNTRTRTLRTDDETITRALLMDNYTGNMFSAPLANETQSNIYLFGCI